MAFFDAQYERLIDDVNEIREQDLTHENLSLMFGTGRSKTVIKNGKKECEYRHGVQTKIGDIAKPVWQLLVKKLIKKSCEEDLFLRLKAWIQVNSPWETDQKEIEDEALRLYSLRIFDVVDWVGFKTFNQK